MPDLDINFNKMITDYFKKCTISVLIIKREEEQGANPVDSIIKGFRYDDILLELPAKISDNGTIVLINNHSLVFNEAAKEHAKSNNVHIIEKPKVILYAWKLVDPYGTAHYSYNQVERLDDTDIKELS